MDMILTRKTMISTLRIIVSLISFLFGLAVVSPAFAQDSLALSVSPTLFEMTANPAQVWDSSIKIINSNNYSDKRGLIWTSWNKKNLNLNFKHDKFSFSKKNVLRGLHYDNKTWKLISCPYGKIFFVDVNKMQIHIYT